MIDFFDNFYDDFYDDFYYSVDITLVSKLTITFSPGEGATGSLVVSVGTGELVVTQLNGLLSPPIGTKFIVNSSSEYLVTSDGNYLIENV